MDLTGGNPLDYTAADYALLGKSGPEAASALAVALQLQEDNAEALEASAADGNEALHGTGAETVTVGGVLAVGSGLSCHLLNGAYWIGGRRYLVDEVAGYAVAALNASETAYLYLGSDGTVTGYAALQSPRPDETCYLGTATTDDADCTAIDDSDADRVGNIAALETRVDAAEADIDALQADMTAAQADIIALESGGGGGGPSYWENLPESSTDPTTPGQAMDAKDTAAVAAHVAALHGGGSGTGATIETPWDVDAVNQAKHLIRYTDHVDDEAPANQVDAVTIVWGVYGDGTGTTPDFVDRVNSTWLPAA